MKDLSFSSFKIAAYCAINPLAEVTYRGKKISQLDKEAVLNTRDDKFLEGFYRLTKEEQIAVRLRYGEDTHRWWTEEGREKYVGELLVKAGYGSPKGSKNEDVPDKTAGQ